MLKTKEEYKAKMSELRKKRDFHLKNADAFQKEMDDLESGREEYEALVGNYIKLEDYRPTYFKVDKLSKFPKTVHLHGHGFHIIKTEPLGIDKTGLLVMDREDAENVKIVTKEEYNNVLDQVIAKIQESILKLKD